MSYHTTNRPGDARDHYLRRGDVARLQVGGIPQLVAPVLGATKVDLKAASAQARSRFVLRAQTNANLLRGAAAGRFRQPVLQQVAVVNGKVVVPTSSLWSEWNIDAKKLIAPFAGAIQQLPVSASLRSSLINTPLDAVFDIFDPIEDALGRAIDKVLAKKGNRQNFFGTMKDLKRVQAVDLKADASTQNLMRRLRTFDAFFVLFFAQPVELAAALLSEGVNIVGDTVEAVTETAQNIAKAVGDTAAGVVEAGAKAASEVASWFGLGGLSGYGHLGGAVGGAVFDDAAAGTAAGGTAAVAGVSIETIIAGVITTIVGAIETAIGTAIVVGTQTATNTIVKGSIDASGQLAKNVSSTFLPGGKSASTKEPPKKSAPAPTKVSTSAAPPPPTSGSGVSPPTSGSGVSPIVLVGGVALAAFFMLRK